jgi:hypothetical protein
VEASVTDAVPLFSYNLRYVSHDVSTVPAAGETHINVNVRYTTISPVTIPEPGTNRTLYYLYANGRLKVFYTNSSVTATADPGWLWGGTALHPDSVVHVGIGEMWTYTLPPSNQTDHVIAMTAIGGDEVNYELLEADPLKGDILRFVREEYMRVQVAQTAALAAFTVPFILKRLFLPSLYIIILAVLARDIAAALGGRSIPLPGL